jgi:predicted RNA binding protein YcfA (HicA-like mRNA interferase family)
MQSRELIKLLQADGWQLRRTRGSHRQFVHPIKIGTIGTAPKERSGKGFGSGDSQARWIEVRT